MTYQPGRMSVAGASLVTLKLHYCFKELVQVSRSFFPMRLITVIVGR